MVVYNLLPVMQSMCEHRIGGRLTVWMRAVHRCASEIGHATDLIGSLFDAQALPLTVTAGSDPDTIALSNAFAPFRRVPGVVTPFIEPTEKLPALVKVGLDVGLWPRWEN